MRAVECSREEAAFERTYHVDLTLPEDQRWREVIEKEAAPVKKMLEEFTRYVPPQVPTWAFGAFRALYSVAGGLYRGEIDAWARGLGVSPGLMLAANYSYELANVGWCLGNTFGCTTSVVDHPEHGPVMVRFLDWDIRAMRETACRFVFHTPSHDFTLQSVPGFVGALTGYVPGRWAAAVNQAPATETPRPFVLGATFLLREVFTSCRTYDEAVAALCHWAVSTPAFYVVCGSEPTQGCVVERLPRAHVLRSLANRQIVQANHHVAEPWNIDRQPTDEGSRLDSHARFAAAVAAADSLPSDLDRLLDRYERAPVLNDSTVQRIVLCPRTSAEIIRE